MQIQVIPRDCGGTEFIAQPHRLHLGRTERRGHRHPGVPAAGGVGRVRRDAAHQALRRHAGGAHPAGHRRRGDSGPQLYRLGGGRVDAGGDGRQRLRRLHPPGPLRRARHPGRWMAPKKAPSPSVYEQFVAQVAANANAAAQSAQSAAASEESAQKYLTQTRAAARQAASNSSMSNSYASRAEAAALQAESYANELKGMLGGA